MKFMDRWVILCDKKYFHKKSVQNILTNTLEALMSVECRMIVNCNLVM